MALHAKAKAEAGYRFYALYDKISREDILAHAYAQCRSNKGAPGVDGQDFADIEAHGVERWLAELARALREETYRPEPIRRVFIPKANGKLRPLGISSVRDRVCMTAANSNSRSRITNRGVRRATEGACVFERSACGWDQQFESPLLHRRVCEPSVPLVEGDYPDPSLTPAECGPDSVRVPLAK
jgi:hypothetical protein